MNESRRWALVTGADSGIGLSLSHELASRGYGIVMVSNSSRRLAEQAPQLQSRHGVETRTLCLDLCGHHSAQEIMQHLDRWHINPQIYINNAGIFSFRPLIDTAEATTDTFIDLHVRAVTSLTRLAARRLKASRLEGYILNMSSMACWTPMPGIALYSATKAYIRAMSRAAAYELRDDNIHIMTACPGGIATDLFGLDPKLMKLAVSIGAVQTPRRFARQCIRRLLKGRQQYINGLLNRLTILAVGLAPARLRMMIKRRMLDRGIRR